MVAASPRSNGSKRPPRFVVEPRELGGRVLSGTRFELERRQVDGRAAGGEQADEPESGGTGDGGSFGVLVGLRGRGVREGERGGIRVGVCGGHERLRLLLAAVSLLLGFVPTVVGFL